MLWKSLLSGVMMCGTSLASVHWSDEVVEDFENIEHTVVFKQWMEDFDRKYASDEEEAQRFLIWLDNWKRILDHNLEGHTYTVALNQFGDLTSDEFLLEVHGHKGSCLQGDTNTLVISTDVMKTREEQLEQDILDAVHKYLGETNEDSVSLPSSNPSSVDWTQEGVVTPVKNQGSCGSCWAFSTTGSIECRYAIATGTLNSLSEQQLVDCSRDYGNDGCNGGLMDYAFEYVEATGGLCSEDEYPYKGTDGICKESSCGTLYDDISSYNDVSRDDSSDLETAVAAGCVSVAIEADQFAFQYYSSGVLDGSCGTSLDHGVLVVGYGTDGDQEYWKVKNSWGDTWGEDGYVLICRDCDKNGKKGECGILEEPSYPDASS